MTYREAAIMFSLMQPCDAAKAIKATVDYYLYGTVPHDLDGAAAQVFKIMHADIDRNAEKYRQTVERNRKNVQKRWEKDDTSGIRVESQSNTNPKPQTLNSKQKPKVEGNQSSIGKRRFGLGNAKRTQSKPPHPPKTGRLRIQNGQTKALGFPALTEFTGRWG